MNVKAFAFLSEKVHARKAANETDTGEKALYQMAGIFIQGALSPAHMLRDGVKAGFRGGEDSKEIS